MYQKILQHHRKKGNLEGDQEIIKILASQEEEVKEITKAIGNTGCVQDIIERWGIEVDNIAITCEENHYREVVIGFRENGDDGCFVGDMVIRKEVERLQHIWKKK